MSLLTLGLVIYAVLSLFSMATMSIGALILTVFLLDDLRKRPGYPPEFERPATRQYIMASLGVSAACILSLIAGKIDPLSFQGNTPAIHLFFDSAKLWYFFWPLALMLALNRITDKERLFVLRCWLFTFTLLSGVGVIQHFTGWPRPRAIPDLPGRFHATLFLGHHLSVASVFIFPFFVLLDFLNEGLKKKEFILPKRTLIAGAVLGFITLMLTFSRMLWVSLPIGLALWAISAISKKYRKSLVMGLVVAALGGSLVATELPSVRNRLLTPLGIQTRKDLWEANYEMFKDRPLTGVGLKHNQELSGFYLMAKYHRDDVFSGHAHNNVLDLLGGVGLIGLAAVAFWFYLIFHWAYNRGVKFAGYSIGSGLFCALVVFQLNGLTQVNLWEAKVQHQLMFAVGWILWGAMKA